jgi:CRISPR-associated protein Cas2
MKTWYLIAYDVCDESRLRRVAKKLEGYGTRVQYSVFRCCLSVRSAERLRWELARIMLPDDDLLIIPLCANCVGKVWTKGTKAWPVSNPTFLIF